MQKSAIVVERFICVIGIACRTKKTKEGLPVCGIQHDSGYINTYDLCPECFDGLIKFMRIDMEGEE